MMALVHKVDNLLIIKQIRSDITSQDPPKKPIVFQVSNEAINQKIESNRARRNLLKTWNLQRTFETCIQTDNSENFNKLGQERVETSLKISNTRKWGDPIEQNGEGYNVLNVSQNGWMNLNGHGSASKTLQTADQSRVNLKRTADSSLKRGFQLQSATGNVTVANIHRLRAAVCYYGRHRSFTQVTGYVRARNFLNTPNPTPTHVYTPTHTPIHTRYTPTNQSGLRVISWPLFVNRIRWFQNGRVSLRQLKCR